MSRIIRCAAVIAMLSLAGCVTAPPEVPFDHSVAGNIHTIAVLTPAMPDKPTVRLASDIGQSFGLIGALVDASMESARDDKLWSMMTEQNYKPRDAFNDAVLAALKARGYDAVLVPVERDGNDHIKAYPSGSSYDAYLDITGIGITYGYMAAGIGASNPYRPFAYIHAKLTKAGSGATLMEDTILYNPVNGGNKVITLSPDPNFVFPDSDSLDADHRKTVAGVDAALHATADTLGSLLK